MIDGFCTDVLGGFSVICWLIAFVGLGLLLFGVGIVCRLMFGFD